MCALDRRLFFDTRLLTQPIQITAVMREPKFKANTSLSIALAAQWQNGYSSLVLECCQFELSDKSLSLREELLAAPDFSTGLPFQYAQSMVFPVQNASSGSNPYFCNITSLLNADLTTIIFHVLEAGDEYPATLNNWMTTGGGNRGCCMYGQKLSNIELRLNGQLLFRFDEDAYEFVKLAEVISPFQCETVYSYAAAAVAPNPPIVSLRKSRLYYYELNLARLRALVTESHLQNTPRYGFINRIIYVSYIILFYFILKCMLHVGLPIRRSSCHSKFLACMITGCLTRLTAIRNTVS
jgi:hypothetical protein